MIDTHCHLNFGAFEGRVGQTIESANYAGVTHFIVPGTDVVTSRKAIEISAAHRNTYAAIGIHPHHVFENSPESIGASLGELEKMVQMHSGIVAIGEVGMDRHYYEMTKYKQYSIDESFIENQKIALKRQIKLAVTYGKSLILHNREVKKEFLELVADCWDPRLADRTVFHCCEPDTEFISFAKERSIFIGVDGDVTFDTAKQEFIKSVPPEMLVVETDSPFLTPEPVRSSAKKRPKNEPANLQYIVSCIAEITGRSAQEIDGITSDNALSLFRLPK